MTLHYVNTNEGLEALREAWKKVGKSRRAQTSTCGVCGCKSNFWRTYGSVTMGIREVLVCPGRDAYPDIHEKIERLQDTLWQDRLPDTTQEEIAIEIVRLRTKFASVRPDIQNESRSND